MTEMGHLSGSKTPHVPVCALLRGQVGALGRRERMLFLQEIAQESSTGGW